MKYKDDRILRGNKFKEYTMKEKVDKQFYDGDIWNPEPYEKITGMYVDLLKNVGRYNQNMYILDTDRLDGKYDKLFGYTSLDRQMKEIEPYTVIEIEYTGKNSEKNYHEYIVNRLRKKPLNK